MSTWFTSPIGAITLTILIAIGTGIALLMTIATQGVSTRTIAASLLILSFVVFCFGAALFVGREFWNWPIGNTHLFWERGFVIAAIVATVLGLALLEDLLRDAGEPVLARIGMVTYLFGAVIVVVAETKFVSSGEWHYPQIVFYVVLAFLAQVAFGASLLQTELVAGWVGWATIIWNLGWLVILPIVHSRDIYFPGLHHIAPLIIRIALLVG